MSALNTFMARGDQDLPVYITEVRRNFLSGAGADLVLDLQRFDGGLRRIFLRLPVSEAASAARPPASAACSIVAQWRRHNGPTREPSS